MIRTFGTGAKTRKVTLDLATGCYAPLLLASSSWDWFSSCSSVSCSRTLLPRRPSRERRLSSIFFRLGLRRHLGRSKAEFPLLSQNRLGLFEPCVQGRDCFRYHGGDLLIDLGVTTVSVDRLVGGHRAKPLTPSGWVTKPGYQRSGGVLFKPVVPGLLGR